MREHLYLIPVISMQVFEVQALHNNVTLRHCLLRVTQPTLELQLTSLSPSRLQAWKNLPLELSKSVERAKP